MSGSLPPGLGFDVNTGIISGTASRSGVFVAVLRSIAGVSTSPVVNVTFNVPPMTGTFTNQAFASSVLPGNPAASALDGNLQTFWISQNDGFPKTLAYDFGAPSAVSSVWLNQGKSNLASSHATQLQILASDDGTNWFVLKEFLNMTNGPNVLTLDPVQTNRYFALQALAGGSSTWAVSEVRLGVYPPNLTLGAATQSGLTLRLTGTVNPNGFITTARFLYGTNSSSLNMTSAVALAPNNGTNPLAVTGTISSGLTLGRTYFYRLGASNVDGVANTEVGSILLRNTNAGLSGLVPNVGALSPAFAAAITNYTVSISNSASLFSLRPTLADGNASVTVNGSGVTSGSSSIPTSLNVGTNIFSAVVTAQDGTTTRTYRVAAIRAPMSLTLSNGGGGLTASDGYVASGPLNLTLGFAPTPGQVITLVNNTSGQATTGIFNGLLEGSTVTLAFGGNTFRFAISYAGGDGNDITLTRIAGPGQVGPNFRPILTLGPATQSGLTLRLTGTVNPNGFVTAARFLYGTNNTNLNLTSNLTLTPNNGTNALAVTGTISSGLTLGRTYFYRLGASNVDGVANTEVGSILLRNTNAGLSGLVPNVGALSPAFAAAITNYTVSISNSASLFSLRPTLADGNASVTVNGSGVTSGSSSIPTSLNVGTNIFSAVVTAQDGTTTRTYRVAAIRAPMSLTLSNGGGGLTASDGYVASGPLNLTLGFAPTPGQVITLVNNTSGQATTGIFNGLLEGSTVTLAFGGNTFRFAISYAGGDGNDITLTRNGGRTVMTLAGGGGPDLLGSGYLDGSGTNSAFRRPNGLAVDGSGNVYVADTLNHRIRKVTPEGLVTTLAGSGNDGFLDGVGTHAAFYAPYGLALDTAGNLFVADTGNQRIRQIRLADTNVTSLAGGGAGFTNNGIGANASFRNPWALTADNQGFVYVADNENNQIRRISLADSNVSTLAGSSALGSADGIGTTATFGLPIGVALGGGNNLFVLDNGNNDPSYGKIRVIQLGSSNVTTLAGGGNSIDGTGTNASFSGPRGLAIDALGNLYVADTGRQTIRKVTSSGVVSTVAGTGLIDYIDGPVAQAAFYDPAGVAVDGSGTIYVADNGNHVIRRITEGFRPILTMGAASRSNNVLRLTGTVNPNGFVTTARFLYGTNRTNLNFTSSVSLSTNNGTNALAVTGTVTLTSVTNSPGFFRLVASNIDGVASTESTSLTTVSVASDGLGNTFLQVTGATPGPTRGGNAIGATRTVYFYASDSSATPSYSGVAWPHVKVSGQLLAGPGVTAVLTMSPAGALLINGRPVYQYINETGATTAAGIGTFWPGIRANGAGTTTAASGPLKP